MRLLAAACVLACVAAPAMALDGVVTDPASAPLAGVTVAAVDAAFGPLDMVVTGEDGAFRFDAQDAGFLVLQPPTASSDSGYTVYGHSPRIYQLGDERTGLALRLPEVANIVLEAYDREGQLMRFGDFEALGRYAGQFAYATNAKRHAVPAAVWSVYGGKTRLPRGPREQGLPVLCVEPGTPVVPTLLFWLTDGYGKLMLSIDPTGNGYSAPAAGEALVVPVNLALAQTAVREYVARDSDSETARDLRSRLAEVEALEDAELQAAAADSLLAEALRARDDFEVRAAREVLAARGAGEFSFGVYGGAPYPAEAFAAARAIGFDLATVLLAWNFTPSPQLNRRRIDAQFGISDLREQGYTVKAHGVVWAQQFDILPARARTLPPETFMAEALKHQEQVLDVFGADVALWEAVNEPAHANIVGLSRAQMGDLMARAADTLRAAGKPVLVNSPPEFAYGSQYLIHRTDNQPLDPFAQSFGAFLDAAQAQGQLDAVDAIGLQFYPGFHFNAQFQNLQGPAQTPAHVRDTLVRFAEYGRAVHITEFSLPSYYGDDWYCGYWRQPWDEATQADYTEYVLTLALALPEVTSFTWWDITDHDSAVLGGGMVRDDGTAKPVFRRMEALIAAWGNAAAEAPGAAE